jgi:orotidine-5'-phosphate decarboxylase
MNRAELIALIRQRNTMLCVGLDTDLQLIPKHLLQTADPIFEFNKQIVDATIDHCVAYKPNIAFYEAFGTKGWIALEKTVAYIRSLKQAHFFDCRCETRRYWQHVKNVCPYFFRAYGF